MCPLIRIVIVLLSIPLGWCGPAWAEPLPMEAKQGVLDANGCDFQKGSRPLFGLWMLRGKKFSGGKIKATEFEIEFQLPTPLFTIFEEKKVA